MQSNQALLEKFYKAFEDFQNLNRNKACLTNP